MNRAYDEIYLNDAMHSLGEAFDYAVNICHIDIDQFMELFITSGISAKFSSGVSKYISGMSGTELALEILSLSNIKIDDYLPQIEYEYSCQYWCGWILAYYQWYSAENFKSIYKSIKLKELEKLYPTLHETSEQKTADTIKQIIKQQKKISAIQRQRKHCGYSQSELAQKSGINLRTLQQYEIGAKDINKASVQSILTLSKSLGCEIEDLLEKE